MSDSALELSVSAVAFILSSTDSSTSSSQFSLESCVEPFSASTDIYSPSISDNFALKSLNKSSPDVSGSAETTTSGESETETYAATLCISCLSDSSEADTCLRSKYGSTGGIGKSSSLKTGTSALLFCSEVSTNVSITSLDSIHSLRLSSTDFKPFSVKLKYLRRIPSSELERYSLIIFCFTRRCIAL